MQNQQHQGSSSQLSTSIDSLIKDWLKERQELIVEYNNVCSLRPFTTTPENPELAEAIQTFCQILVDYISMGQFEIFEKILTVTEQAGPSINKTNKRLLKSLLRTTLAALDFNDKHATNDSLENIASLEQDLSTLGEKIAVRLELEDELIENYSVAKNLTTTKVKTA